MIYAHNDGAIFQRSPRRRHSQSAHRRCRRRELPERGVPGSNLVAFATGKASPLDADRGGDVGAWKLRWFCRHKGKMINFFDLNTGISDNRVHTEKTHRDGTIHVRGGTDLIKSAQDLSNPPVKGKSVKSVHKGSLGISVKIILEEELSKERGTCQGQSVVTANLVGLENVSDRSQKTFSKRTVPESLMWLSADCTAISNNRKKEKKYKEKRLCHTVHHLSNSVNSPRSYSNVSENCQPSKARCIQNMHLSNGRYDSSSSGMRIGIEGEVAEAKGLIPLQTKASQNTPELLSSDRCFFHTCPEEPQSLLPEYFQKVQKSTRPPLAKCITVLKPSIAVDGRVDKIRKNSLPVVEDNCRRIQASFTSNPIHNKPEKMCCPTRIVLLKPSSGKAGQVKALVTSQRYMGDKESKNVVHILQEVTRERQKSPDQRSDGTFLSHTLSNGYVADGSTMCLSGDECTTDEFVVSSNPFEHATCKSPNSSDCCNNNKLDRAYSSSASKLSYSHESPVINEAKRRLSQRLVMVAAKRMSCEGKSDQGSTSTLLEVLALPDMKQTDMETEHIIDSESSRHSFCAQSGLKAFSFSSFVDRNTCDEGQNDIRSLKRSKSVPSSSLIYEDGGSNVEIFTSQASKSASVEDKLKKKSSFKGKVSNLFFLHGKKTGWGKSLSSPSGLANVDIQSATILSCSGIRNDWASESSTYGLHDLKYEREKSRCPSAEDSVPLEKANTAENTSESSPPSQVSTSEAVYEDENAKGRITKSPPIESVARSLSVKHSQISRTRSHPAKHLRDLLMADIEEHERIMFIQSLLASVGIENQISGSVVKSWHSLESPLDPALLEKYIQCKAETSSREKRSNSRLLFDCVNAVLLETACDPTVNSLTERVLHRLREWFSRHENCLLGVSETYSQAVERIVRRDFGGRGWDNLARLEIAELGSEIGNQVLDQLLGEALDHITGLQ